MIERIAPFRQTAENKGGKFSFQPPKELHLDMNMVELSLQDALTNTENEKLVLRLQNLIKIGTDSEKINFVMGQGEYYFPEDLEKLATLSRSANGKVELMTERCTRTCDWICYVVCRCLPGENDQECDDRCRSVCYLDCG